MAKKVTPVGPSRRIIPPGYRVFELTLEGDSPLLMNSSEYDRQGDTYRAFRQLGSKRGKTHEDELRLAELEFHLALHYDAELGVFVPGINVKELIRSAATKFRKGEEIRRSMIVPEFRLALAYDGPRLPSELWEAGFYDVRMVANAGAGSGRVPRCRPMFVDWTVVTELAIDPVELDDHVLQDSVDRSVKYGFGDGRTIGFGAFRPQLRFLRVERSDSNADATKARNEASEAAHQASVRKVIVDAEPLPVRRGSGSAKAVAHSAPSDFDAPGA